MYNWKLQILTKKLKEIKNLLLNIRHARDT